MPENETIAAIATPPGEGAISLLRISGDGALEIARQVFSPLPSIPSPRFQYFGTCRDEDGSIIDETLLTWFQSPASYTGEDVIEIGCHGGPGVTRCLLERLFALGASPAEPGEFSKRAFLNGKIDLTRAEAVMDLISAKSELAVKAAGQQLAGQLAERVESIRREIIGIVAHIEAYIDFPDEDIDPDSLESICNQLNQTGRRIEELLDTAERGKMLREGIRTVLCGAPNAGKSSLLNQLVGFERAIVSQQAGTTRDTIEETISLGGIAFCVIDTAGIRDSEDSVEQAGVQRTFHEVDRADLVLLIADSTEKKCDQPEVADNSATVISVLNKTDLAPHADWEQPAAQWTKVSCLTGEGLPELVARILQETTGNEKGFPRKDLCAINARHQHHLKIALSQVQEALRQLEKNASPEFVSFELREALDAVGAVAGKTDVEEILGSIFSSFCIGK